MAGKSPVLEPGLPRLLKEVVDSGRFKATVAPEQAVIDSELSFVCVGTYSSADGFPDLRAVYHVMDEIGRALKRKRAFHSVIIRSTVPPGTTEIAMHRLSMASGNKAGKGFGGGMNPEFMREGSALEDFRKPPFIVVGTQDAITARRMRRLYQFIDAPYYQTGTRVAENIKYCCNAFHAVKVAFANEVGRLCSVDGIDSRELMEIFVRDRALNISGKYLRPGAPFGGSCLPKDLRAYVRYGESRGVNMLLLDAAQDSNDAHFAEVLRRVEKIGLAPVGILGLTFKEHTDDIRESPHLKLARCLLDRGCEVRIYDRNLKGRNLVGTNQELLERLIPEYRELQAESVEDLMRQCRLIILTTGRYVKDDRFRRLLNRGKNVILDLDGGYGKICPPERYHGLCW
jgi:GDP-mannose 6-dehydrogenase